MELLQLLAGLRGAFIMCALAGVGFIVAAVLWLNGGIGPFRAPGAALLACAGAASFAFFMLGARWNSSIRKLVLRPDASIPHVMLGLDFLGWAGALLALGLLATALSLSHAGA